MGQSCRPSGHPTGPTTGHMAPLRIRCQNFFSNPSSLDHKISYARFSRTSLALHFPPPPTLFPTLYHSFSRTNGTIGSRAPIGGRHRRRQFVAGISTRWSPAWVGLAVVGSWVSAVIRFAACKLFVRVCMCAWCQVSVDLRVCVVKKTKKNKVSV